MSTPTEPKPNEPKPNEHKDLLARALLELRTLRQRLAEAQRAAREPIAVVGLGCRFPGDVDTPDDYWRLLCDGRDATGDLPPGRWPEHTGPDPDGMYTRRGGFLKTPNVDGFDARFFGVTEREAHSLDPQHRLALEVSWEALEHAAIAPDRLRRSRSGVFLGVSVSDYAHLLAAHTPLAEVDGYFGPGTALNFAAGRIAYFLGLMGPSLVVDTACSSSLVAVHLACHSLRSRETDLALAGGVNLMLSPAGHLVLCRGRVLSPEGRCKSFAADADGYARGEGCGVVVLRRLADALADGDRVLAVIRGSAVNQDGPSSGLTVPNGAAQEAVVREALAFAGLEPRDLAYVEAHGTGTPLGDPIEARSLAAALGPGRTHPLLIGTVKTNIGHLEAAAGIAGLIKVVLALHHGELPRQLNFRETKPNPAIAWDRLPLEVVTTHRAWPEGPRIAGVSSFGASGTNAHLILGAHDPQPATPQPSSPPLASQPLTAGSPPASTSLPASPPGPALAPRPELFLLSAHTPAALQALAARHAAHIAERPGLSLTDRCYTAAIARARLPHALAIITDHNDTLKNSLLAVAHDDLAATPRIAPTMLARRPREAPRIVFLFSGQGAQQPGMGSTLLTTMPVFRDALQRCETILRPHLPRPLLEVLHPAEGMASPLDETAWTQPALFAFEWALSCQWRAWGVEPAAVLGHSLGEYVAATVAGVFQLEQVLPLIARRARLMQSLPGGAMAAVTASESELTAILPDYPGVAIAAINGAQETVIAGPHDAMRTTLEHLTARGLRCRQLRVSHAFHSPMMDPALAAFEADVATIPRAVPLLPLISNLSGQLAGPEVTRADYYRRHMREPVRFADGLATLRARGHALFLEIGPGTALTALGARNHDTATWLPSLRSGQSERSSLLETLGALAVRGVDLDVPALHADAPRRRVALPTYPFQRQRHWLIARPTTLAPSHPLADLPLIGRPIADPGHHTFEAELRADQLGVLRDHTVYGQIVISGTVHAAMVLRAMQEVAGAPGPFVLEAVEFLAPLLLPDDAAIHVRTRITRDGDETHFELLSRDGDVLTLHTRGRIHTAAPTAPQPPARDMLAIQTRCPEQLTGEVFYDRFWRPDEHALGPSFRTITQLWRRDGEVLARLQPPAIDLEDHRGLGPDALLAACLGEVHGQLLMPAMPGFASTVQNLTHTFLGQSFARSREHAGPPQRAAYAHAVLRGFDGDELCGDVVLLDHDGLVLASVDGLRARQVPRSLLQHALIRSHQRRIRPTCSPATLRRGPPEQLRARVHHYLREQLAAVVGGAPDFDPAITLGELGVDSLMTVDLHDAVRSDLGVSLSLASVLQGDTLEQLGDQLTAALQTQPDVREQSNDEPSLDPTSPTITAAISPEPTSPTITAAISLGPTSPTITAAISPEPASITAARSESTSTPSPRPLVTPSAVIPPALTTRPLVTPWLRAIGPVPAQPRLRLICFPHSGAGPSAFQPWRGRLPPDVLALAVQLPGRWERLGEPPIDRMDRLLDVLLPALAPALEPPFVFFGVSMGALVAHALTNALRRAGRPLPAHLFVAAYPAPHLPNPLLRHRDVLRAALRDDTGDRQALHRLGLIPEALQTPDTMRLLIPALRADFELVLNHEPRDEPPLPIPLTALGGVDDPEVSRDQLAAWLPHTAADFALRLLPGGHLFFRTHPETTLAALAPTLRLTAP